MNKSFKYNCLRSIAKAAFYLLLLSTLVSCTTHRSAEGKLWSALNALDDLAKIHEEYGTVVMSYPQLSRLQDSHYFDLNRDSTDYFNEAKTLSQGGSSHAIMIANSLAGTAQVKNNPMLSIPYGENLQQYNQYQAATTIYQAKQLEICDALKNLWSSENDPVQKSSKLTDYESCLEKLKPPTVNPPTSDLPTDPQATKIADEGKNLLADSKLNPSVGDLLKGSASPSISNREAIAIAAGDKAVETVYRLLGNADTASQYKDKVLLVGVSTVSVNPGWRTREDFTAKLQAQLLIKYDKARYDVKRKFIHRLKALKLADEGIVWTCTETNMANCVAALPSEFQCDTPEECSSGINPLVAAVSPLTDTQTLDLSNSARKVMEYSLALAGALKDLNVEAQASIMEQYVSSNQHDAKTRSANIVTNAYSINGGIFGYQIAPKFVGLNTQGEEDDTANVMQQQSFPVLLLIGLDRFNLDPKVICKHNDKDSQLNEPQAVILQCDLYEPQLIMQQTFDWLIWNEHWYKDPGIYPSDYIKANLALNKANAVFENAADLSPQLQQVDQLLQLKTTLLKYPGGSYSKQSFPLDVIFPEQKNNPSITEILPKQISLKRENGNIAPKNVDLLIRGISLQDSIDINHSIAQGDLTKTSAKILSDSEIRISTTITGAAPIYFKLPLKNDPGHFLFTAPITVEALDVKSP